MSPCTSAARLGAFLAIVCIGGACSAADEAVRPEGGRIAGSLRADEDGRLRFVANSKESNLALTNIAHFRFPDAASHSTLLGAPLRFRLLNGQAITGELLELDEKSIWLRTFWSDRVQLPRRAVVALTQLPGLVTIFREDFERDPVRLELQGSPAVDDNMHASGHRSLKLDAAGQSASFRLPAPLNAGRVGVNFKEAGNDSGALWTVGADLGGKEPLRIELAGSESYSVQTELAGETRRLAREPGWRRLEIRFRPDYLLVGIDGRLLFETTKSGPGALREVRLACVASGSGKSVSGAVHFDDLAIAESVDELRHERGDPGQDEVWLRGGDQLFGRVVRADGRAIEIEGRFGKRSLPWSSLRGLFLENEATTPQTSDGQHVRVWLQNGFPEPDELEGVIRKLDDHEVVIRHALLGELKFDRSRLRRLRPLFFGRRIEIDNARHHLGEAGREVPNLFPPRAEGPKLQCTIRIDSVPPAAQFGVTVQHVQTVANTEGALTSMEGRSELWINGRRIDDLARRADRASQELVHLSVAIPSGVLRAGENIVEVRRVPETPTGRLASCVISDLALELPR